VAETHAPAHPSQAARAPRATPGARRASCHSHGCRRSCGHKSPMTWLVAYCTTGRGHCTRRQDEALPLCGHGARFGAALEPLVLRVAVLRAHGSAVNALRHAKLQSLRLKNLSRPFGKMCLLSQIITANGWGRRTPPAFAVKSTGVGLAPRPLRRTLPRSGSGSALALCSLCACSVLALCGSVLARRCY
jgi:hypothetical protein